MSEPVHYHVSFDLDDHFINAECRVPADRSGDGAAEFWMAVWTPGSYVLREFSGKVQDVTAEAGGRDVPVEQTAKNRWRVDPAAAGVEDAGEVTLRWRVFAFEPTVRTPFVDPDRAVVVPAAVWMMPDGMGPDDRFEVEVSVPGDFTVCLTQLEPAPGDGGEGSPVRRFAGTGVDWLLDSPIHLGRHQVRSFTSAGCEHVLAAYADEGGVQPDADRIAGDLERITAAAADVFGEMPNDRYVFFLEAFDEAYGGLEHLASSHSQCCRDALTDDARYRREVLSLLSHEYFHLWNVKRIRPAALGPFDYEREVHTEHLWISEGLTSYYQDLVLRRAEVCTAEQYLGDLAGTIRTVLEGFGRTVQSVAESSWTAWTKFYRRDAESHNRTVSYYTKGALLGLALDLRAIRDSDGERRLDHAMRALWDHCKDGPGFDDDVLRAALQQAVGDWTDEFMERYVHGTDDPPLEDLLRDCGLTLEEPSEARDKRREQGGLGCAVSDEGGRAKIAHVRDDTAARAAGLQVGDELIAVAGRRVTASTAPEVVRTAGAGADVTLEVARRGYLRTLEARLDPAPRSDWRIRRATDPDEQARAACRAWLGVAWADLGDGEEAAVHPRRPTFF